MNNQQSTMNNEQSTITNVSFPEFEQLIDVPHYRQLEQQFTVSEASPPGEA